MNYIIYLVIYLFIYIFSLLFFLLSIFFYPVGTSFSKQEHLNVLVSKTMAVTASIEFFTKSEQCQYFFKKPTRSMHLGTLIPETGYTYFSPSQLQVGWSHYGTNDFPSLVKVNTDGPLAWEKAGSALDMSSRKCNLLCMSH